MTRRRLIALLACGALLVAVAGIARAALAGGESEPVTRVATHAKPSAVHYVSPSGRDAAPCTRARPCRTLTRALAVSKPGAEVILRAGDYPEQELEGGHAGKPVVFRPERGARVQVGSVSMTAHDVEFRDLRLNGWYAHPGSGRLTFRRVRTPWFFVDSVSDIKILGGTVGPADSVDSQIRAANTEGAPVPRNILIDGVTFRDMTRRKDPAAHVECLQFGAGDHVIVRRSRFYNCATQGIFVNSWGGTAYIRDFTFENNFFGSVPDGYYSLRVGTGESPTRGIRVLYNSASVAMQVDEGVQDVEYIGNVGPREAFQCLDGQKSSFNVWSKTRCGPTDRIGAPRFADVAKNDLHLAAGSAAIGAGAPTGAPKVDIDGQRRPRQRRSDAGADQR